MPTHQSLSGASDDDLLQRMVKTHPERFGEDYRKFFDAHVAPHLPSRPTMIDLGCGPGLFLRDLGQRSPGATLYGYDVTPAMIAHGRQLPSTGAPTTLAVHDVATQPLPHAAGTVHLVSMSSVLHVFEEPWPMLAEIRRLLAAGGIFLLHDWIRQPLETYLACRRDRSRRGPSPAARGRRRRRLGSWPRWAASSAGLRAPSVVMWPAQTRPCQPCFTVSAATPMDRSRASSKVPRWKSTSMASASRMRASVSGAVKRPSWGKTQTCRSIAQAYVSRKGRMASIALSPSVGSTSTWVRIAVVPWRIAISRTRRARAAMSSTVITRLASAVARIAPLDRPPSGARRRRAAPCPGGSATPRGRG